jgi:cytochrome c oxidase subunit II
MIMAAMLAIMMAVIVVTSIAGALDPSGNVEVVEPLTPSSRRRVRREQSRHRDRPRRLRHGAAHCPQHDFVPHCVRLPTNTSVKFRPTSGDVAHVFLLPDTNVNTMVVPGFVADVRTSFAQPGDYTMPCHEFCGLGHHAMSTR